MLIITTRNRIRKALKEAYEKGLNLGWEVRQKSVIEGEPRIRREVEEILRRENF